MGFALVTPTFDDYKLKSYMRTIEYCSWPLISHLKEAKKQFGRYPKYAIALSSDGPDRFYLVEQTFVCLPFMHSELIADQDRCVLLFAGMAVTAPEELAESKRNGLDFATKHRDIIRRFGRFPHRNGMLGRESTEEEAIFIAKHGRGF